MAQSQTKSYRERAGTGGSPASARTEAPFDGMNPAPGERDMELAKRMGESFFEGVTSMNREFLRFLSTRFQEDMRAARSFAHCRHPSEFVEAELRFMQSLVNQYADNANRMLGIAARVAGHNLDDMEDRMEEAVRRPGAVAPERSAA